MTDEIKPLPAPKLEIKSVSGSSVLLRISPQPTVESGQMKEAKAAEGTVREVKDGDHDKK